MGIVSSFVRMVAYPVIRPMESVRDAAVQIRGDLAKGREAREKHQADLAERAKQFAADGDELTQEQLLSPALIVDPRRRFAAVAKLNQWSEAGLAEQLVAVRRGRRFALFAALLVLFFAVVMFGLAPVWIVVVLAPCLCTAIALALAQAFKYGLYQYQLESRTLFGVRDYLSRPDFMRHITS